jgi:hypothetical protein
MSITDRTPFGISTVSPNVTPSTVPSTIEQNRSTAMSLMHEELARAQRSARLGEAQQLRQGHHLARARRLSRKAEEAAQQARLALARAL